MNITHIIAAELNAAPHFIEATVELLDGGATIPFIARYRKERTGGLDDQQLRTLAERLQYLRELAARKETVLESITAQGKLTPELANAIAECTQKTALEDLYLPYKPKRRSKAQIAREHGLEPLAEQLLNEQPEHIETLAAAFCNEHVADIQAALDGARAILMEHFAENAALIGALRERLWREGVLKTQVIAEKETIGEKFKDYFHYQEKIQNIPSHRALAVLRGRNEDILQLSLLYQDEETPSTARSPYETMIAEHFAIAPDHVWLNDCVRLAWRAKIVLSLELELLNRLKEHADRAAIEVFAHNLKDLLLSPPAGRTVTLGLDPGYRHGIKCAVVDDTGKLLATTIVYLHQENALRAQLKKMIIDHRVSLIAIGNGTASRETTSIITQLLKEIPEHAVRHTIVSEAGASVYSASELAAQEFPELDVSLRGAVSIARRAQDPLAELVKIEPKAIGVGQYQHDVNQAQLAQALDAVVEDCVNAVGVDVNTASVSLLARISGLNQTLARNIVAFRDEHGAFSNRKLLLKVPRLGAKTFEQAAGFLRIHGGDEALDASAVHPETYSVVKKMLTDCDLTARDCIGNKAAIARIQPQRYITDQFGLPTILDILSELEKPNRDPRGDFQFAHFAEEIQEISDLKSGMILEGVVSNVANFGAFVDIGVHQDGLVHISELSHQFVTDPRTIVKAGDVVKVKVVSVDVARKRIALTMRLDDKPAKKSIKPQTALAAAFKNMKK